MIHEAGGGVKTLSGLQKYFFRGQNTVLSVRKMRDVLTAGELISEHLLFQKNVTISVL